MAAARGREGLLPHESEPDSVGGHHRRQRHTGERAGGAGVLGGRNIRVGIPGERIEDERHVRHTAFAYFVLRDDGAVAVCVDLAAQQISHRFPQFRGAGQHEFAELDDVRIRDGATLDADGVCCRAHIPKP